MTTGDDLAPFVPPGYRLVRVQGKTLVPGASARMDAYLDALIQSVMIPEAYRLRGGVRLHPVPRSDTVLLQHIEGRAHPVRWNFARDRASLIDLMFPQED